MTSLTAIEIPCCLCGTMILPNNANQCQSCLAAEVDLKSVLQRGQGGSHDIIIHQCRQCRAFRVTDKLYRHMDMESNELLSVCLKHLPALNNSSGKIKVVDAMWIWTEPNSMRLKIRLTVRTTIEGVPVQQRVPVELKIQFRQCLDCNREYTNRTWHAVVQLRQKRSITDNDAPKKGLAALEMALAKNATIRKHVLKIDSTRNGFDFYFLTLPEAQSLASYLSRVAPMRIRTTKKLVSTDVKSNTANLKHTVTCDLVPLCRDDLIIIHKSAKGIMSGRMALVTKVSSVVHLMDANAKRSSAIDHARTELAPETYYKSGGEKLYQLVQTSNRMVRFVVLDVELCDGGSSGFCGGGGAAAAADSATAEGQDDNKQQQKPGPTPFALADVEVARESDFGVNDETFRCVTHLGNILSVGDIVLGYDLNSTVLSGGAEWDMDKCFQSSFVMPDVVLVKKIKEKTLAKENAREVNPEDEDNTADATNKKQSSKGRMSKRKEKRRMRNAKKAKELEESAVRMGFVPAEDVEEDFMDEDLVADLEAIENELAAIEATNEEEKIDSGGEIS